MDNVEIVIDVLHAECKKRWEKYSYSNEPHHKKEHEDTARKIVAALCEENKS